MNQKTKHLLEAAGFEYISHDNIGWAGNHNASLPKLVELVVRECVRQIEAEAAQYAEPTWAVELVNDILEQFGVTHESITLK